ncbi:hypothetical protein PIB30_088553 [Stylosanthes scabra]|uniref:Secreted protein n=1 Tax=Stylosanthes scabra TaxID=79078 RepID=A0ABU6RUD6_9FABA|nr:hypothetical protein [Stylosanthes scabra]
MRGSSLAWKVLHCFPRICLLFYAYARALGQAGMLRSRLSSSKCELKRELSGFPCICVGLLRLCVDGKCKGATLKGSGVGSAWMHTGQGNFPRICVDLRRLCVGVKLVRESGSRLNMSRRELERELVGPVWLSTHMRGLSTPMHGVEAWGHA